MFKPIYRVHKKEYQPCKAMCYHQARALFKSSVIIKLNYYHLPPYNSLHHVILIRDHGNFEPVTSQSLRLCCHGECVIRIVNVPPPKKKKKGGSSPVAYRLTMKYIVHQRT